MEARNEQGAQGSALSDILINIIVINGQDDESEMGRQEACAV